MIKAVDASVLLTGYTLSPLPSLLSRAHTLSKLLCHRSHSNVSSSNSLRIARRSAALSASARRFCMGIRRPRCVLVSLLLDPYSYTSALAARLACSRRETKRPMRNAATMKRMQKTRTTPGSRAAQFFLLFIKMCIGWLTSPAFVWLGGRFDIPGICLRRFKEIAHWVKDLPASNYSKDVVPWRFRPGVNA